MRVLSDTDTGPDVRTEEHHSMQASAISFFSIFALKRLLLANSKLMNVLE